MAPRRRAHAPADQGGQPHGAGPPRHALVGHEEDPPPGSPGEILREERRRPRRQRVWRHLPDRGQVAPLPPVQARQRRHDVCDRRQDRGQGVQGHQRHVGAWVRGDQPPGDFVGGRGGPHLLAVGRVPGGAVGRGRRAAHDRRHVRQGHGQRGLLRARLRGQRRPRQAQGQGGDLQQRGVQEDAVGEERARDRQRHQVLRKMRIMTLRRKMPAQVSFGCPVRGGGSAVMLRRQRQQDSEAWIVTVERKWGDGTMCAKIS
mmetsp:Transcript_35400/g.89401  ORF Transcript_35400/g.89401 Transcript_35400/m.89401 type:complete len:259 (-) Transcript_35400:44-820(-)